MGAAKNKKRIRKQNIDTKFINGLRVTDENIIKIVEEVLIDFNLDIVTSLKKNGSDAISIHSKENNIINVNQRKRFRICWYTR